jgi:hypothetical protein
VQQKQRESAAALPFVGSMCMMLASLSIRPVTKRTSGRSYHACDKPAAMMRRGVVRLDPRAWADLRPESRRQNASGWSSVGFSRTSISPRSKFHGSLPISRDQSALVPRCPVGSVERR